MPYTKQTWANDAAGGTPLSAARLQYMEDGIDAIDADVVAEATARANADAGKADTGHTHVAVAATTITTATHTATAADAGKVVRMTFVGASTLTIPANDTTPLAIGTVINAYAAGGALTIAAAAGVTIRNNAAALAQYGEASLRKDGTDEWVRVG